MSRELSQDEFLCIAGFLKDTETLVLCAVCHQFNTWLGTESFWAEKMENDFPRVDDFKAILAKEPRFSNDGPTAPLILSATSSSRTMYFIMKQFANPAFKPHILVDKDHVTPTAEPLESPQIGVRTDAFGNMVPIVLFPRIYNSKPQLIEIVVKFNGKDDWNGIGLCSLHCLQGHNAELFKSPSNYVGHYCRDHYNVGYFSNGYIGEMHKHHSFHKHYFAGKDEVGLMVHVTDKKSIKVAFFANNVQQFKIMETTIVKDDEPLCIVLNLAKNTSFQVLRFGRFMGHFQDSSTTKAKVNKLTPKNSCNVS